MKRPRLPNRSSAIRSLLPLLGLFILPLILFAPVTLGSRTLLPVDNLFAFEPYLSAADELGVDQPHNHLLSDLILQNYAWKRFIVQSIQARQLPLWNPYLFAGSPFLAAGHHSALYPLSAIFYVLPLWRAYGFFAVIQLGLAGVFMYILTRVLGISRLGALVAGMTFELSGFFVVSVVHPMIIAAAAWLPLILAAIELILQQHPFLGRPATIPWVILGALALGCSTLAGHAEVLYFLLLVSAFYTGWRLIYQLANSHSSGAGKLGIGTLGYRAGWILVMVVLGLGLGAIQLVPSAELVNSSFREGRASLSQIRGWAYPVRRVLAFLVPNLYGNPAHHDYLNLFTGQVVQSPRPIDWGIKNYVEGGAYLGILPLFLAGLAVLNGFTNPRIPNSRSSVIRNFAIRILEFFRNPYIPLFSVLALFSLAFIFGTPLYALVYALPFLSQSHSPFRWVFPLTLCVAVLAGFGIDVVRRSRHNLDAIGNERALESTLRVADHESRNPLLRLVFLDGQPSLVTFLAAIAFWGGLLIIAGLVVSRLFFEPLEPFITRVFHSLAKADTAFADVRAFFSYEFRWLLLGGLMLVGTGITLRVSQCPIYLPRRLGRRPVWEVLAVGLLALDLLLFGWGFHSAADPALLDYVPPVVEFLKEDEGLWRLTTYDPRDRKTFDKNAAWFYDLEDIRGYDSLFTAQYRDYMRLIDEQDELLYNRIAPLRAWSALDSPMLDMLNVKYVLTEERLDESPKYRLAYEDESLRVYENLGVMPRAYQMSYPCTTTTENPLVTMQEVDPRQTVIVHPDDLPLPLASSEEASCTPGPVQAVTYNMPNEVFVDVQAEAPSWLVLTDSYAPGWKAFVRPLGGTEDDEAALDVVKVAGNFRGVVLDAGSWTVRFKYSPDSVKIGAFISFLSATICFFLAAAWLWRFFYREPDDVSIARRVTKNSVAPIVMNLMNRTVDMAFAALMARILGPEGSGKFYYAIVIFGWFDIAVNWGLNALLIREVSRDKGQANRYFVNTTVLRLILWVLCIPLLLTFILGRQTLGETDLARDTIGAILLLYLGLAPFTIATGLTALFQAFEKHEIPAAITSVTTLLKVTLGTLVLMLGWSIIGLAGVSIVTNLITLTILSVFAVRLFFRPRLEIDRYLQRVMAIASFPLMLNHLMATLFFRVDIFLLEGLKNRRGIDGNVLVGWYSWAYKGIDALNVIPAFFTFAIFPIMARQAHEDRPALSITYHLAIKLMVVLALPAAMAMTLLARPFIAVLGGSAFLPDSVIALQIMVWSIPIGWINSVTNYVLIALDQQRFLTRTFVIGLAFNSIANWWFIPLYDYRAAAVITIFSELVLLIAFYVGIHRYLAPVPWWTLLWRPTLAGAAMVAVGLALWPVNTFLALLVSLGLYALGLFVLGAFTTDEIALITGRRRDGDMREQLDLAEAQ